MTALEQYQRLEAAAHWTKGDAPPREVLIQFGEASLVLNSFDDAPLAHWSIPAMVRVRIEGDVAVYALDNDLTETLTLSDPDMRDALDTILAGKALPKDGTRGKHRWVYLGITLVAVIALGISFGPRLLASQIERLIAPERAALIALDMLPLIEARTGPTCESYAARAALSAIAGRLNPADPPVIHVLDLGDMQVLGLPGNHIVLSRDVVESARTPEEIVGWAAAAMTEAQARPAFFALVEGDGMAEGFAFLSKGTLSTTAVETMVNTLLIQAQTGMASDPEDVGRVLASASVLVQPLNVGLARFDLEMRIPQDEIIAGPPVLNDTAWVALQEICSN